MLSNQTAINPVRVSHRLARLLLGQEEPPKPAPKRLAAPERLHWHDPAGDGTLTLTPADEGLMIDGVGVFTGGADGRWHGTGFAEGGWMEIDGDRLLLNVGPLSRPLSSSTRPSRPRTRRCPTASTAAGSSASTPS
ncbi:hypothetical protein [Nonomuraea recticatena]|uniref:hypothetical protein n=1 Tax=Nonomuraea recticatena TaxID=46178 RepID=UPI00361237DA